MLYMIIRAFIKLFGNYNDIWGYHSLYIGDICFYMEISGYPAMKEVILITNDRKGKTIYSCTKDI